jgi:transcriptional regulator with XRE-family HTH domain
MRQADNGGSRSASRAVNDDIRRAAANLALVIRECGLSQSELARRSGLSRQLINGWARQRVPMSLSTTVGRLLSAIKLSLADLLLDEQTLYAKLGRTLRVDGGPAQILPRLKGFSRTAAGRGRLQALAGTFRYRTRLKESPLFVLERTFQFEPYRDNDGALVKAFDGPHVGNRPFAEGHCLYHQSMFFLFVESTYAPYRPLLYAYRDPNTPRITSLNGVSIAPAGFGRDMGLPTSGLAYMHRINADGSAIAEPDFDPEREFNTYIPADGCTVLTAF